VTFGYGSLVGICVILLALFLGLGWRLLHPADATAGASENPGGLEAPAASEPDSSPAVLAPSTVLELGTRPCHQQKKPPVSTPCDTPEKVL
jgi:hypothetical protein